MLEFESLETLKEYISTTDIQNIAVQSLDLSEIEELVLSRQFRGCLFLGCHLTPALWEHLSDDNYLFPVLDVPFNVYPKALYNKDILYENYDYQQPETYQETLDKRVYDHYLKMGKEATVIKETLARRLHDHSITDALQDFLREFEEKKVVAIMGGHGLARDHGTYQQVAEISKILTEKGYLMISGGGPGAMEATHVGAWFAGGSKEKLDAAVEMLSKAPKYDHPDWLPTAFEVMDKFPCGPYRSLGIPTWLYGHEPPTPFATHIAKYFANSVREEGLLAIAKGGVIFAPGSAGTIQEVFQDITQNHYESFGYASPMVFLNKEYWSYDRPIYPVIELMHLRGNLKNLDLGIYDRAEEVIAHIDAFV